MSANQLDGPTPRRWWWRYLGWLRRQRPRFSLRALVLFVLVLSMMFAAGRRKIDRVRQQAEVFNGLYRIGEYRAERSPDYSVGAAMAWPFVDDANKVTALDASVDPESGQVASTVAKYAAINIPRLKRFPHLERLDLHGLPVEDDDLAFVEYMPSLRHLDLRATSVTDAGLKRLRGHANLEVVAPTSRQQASPTRVR